MGCFVVAEFLLTSASRGPSAIAEPLVKKYKMADGRHFEKRWTQYLCSHRPILMKFGIMMHLRRLHLMGSQKFDKFENFKMQDGGRRPSWKSKNRDISETVWQILTKFCMTLHISSPELTRAYPLHKYGRFPAWRNASNATKVLAYNLTQAHCVRRVRCVRCVKLYASTL